MSARAALRAVSPAPDEAIDLLVPLDQHNRLALSSTACGMEAQIQTTDRPVVLYVAPRQKQDPPLCDECKRVQNIDISGK